MKAETYIIDALFSTSEFQSADEIILKAHAASKKKKDQHTLHHLSNTVLDVVKRKYKNWKIITSEHESDRGRTYHKYRLVKSTKAVIDQQIKEKYKIASVA